MSALELTMIRPGDAHWGVAFERYPALRLLELVCQDGIYHLTARTVGGWRGPLRIPLAQLDPPLRDLLSTLLSQLTPPRTAEEQA